MQKAATAPLRDKLRFFRPWLHMAVAKANEALKRKIKSLSITVRPC